MEAFCNRHSSRESHVEQEKCKSRTRRPCSALHLLRWLGACYGRCCRSGSYDFVIVEKGNWNKVWRLFVALTCATVDNPCRVSLPTRKVKRLASRQELGILGRHDDVQSIDSTLISHDLSYASAVRKSRAKRARELAT